MNNQLINAYVHSHRYGGFGQFARQIHALIISAMTDEELDKANELITTKEQSCDPVSY